MPSDSPGRGAGISVLIVEDDPDLAEMLTRYLTPSGLEVRVATDGEIAWKMVQASAPTVVVTDLMIPGLSGSELVARLRSDTAFAKIPIIAMSASMNGQEQATAMAPILDVNAALSKPLQLKELLHTVLRLGGAPSE